MNAPTTAAGPDAGGAAPTVRRRWRPPVWLVALLVTIGAFVAVAGALDVRTTSGGADLTAGVTLLAGALVGGLAAAVTVVALGVSISRLLRPPASGAGPLRRGSAVVVDVLLWIGGIVVVLAVGAVALVVAVTGLVVTDSAEDDRSAAELRRSLADRLPAVEGVRAVRSVEAVPTGRVAVFRTSVVVRAELDADLGPAGRGQTVDAVVAVLAEDRPGESRGIVRLTDGRLDVGVTGAATTSRERLAVAESVLAGTDVASVTIPGPSASDRLGDDAADGSESFDERFERVELLGDASPAETAAEVLPLLPGSWRSRTSLEIATRRPLPSRTATGELDAALLGGQRALTSSAAVAAPVLSAARALEEQPGVLGYALGGVAGNRVAVADAGSADAVAAVVLAALAEDGDAVGGTAPGVTVVAADDRGKAVEVLVS